MLIKKKKKKHAKSYSFYGYVEFISLLTGNYVLFSIGNLNR